MYALLCPTNSEESLIPPKDIFTKFLFNAYDIDSANVVFPTPGGPTKQSIGLLISGDILLTAIYSIILVFAFSIP